MYLFPRLLCFWLTRISSTTNNGIFIRYFSPFRVYLNILYAAQDKFHSFPVPRIIFNFIHKQTLKLVHKILKSLNTRYTTGMNSLESSAITNHNSWNTIKRGARCFSIWNNKKSRNTNTVRLATHVEKYRWSKRNWKINKYNMYENAIV